MATPAKSDCVAKETPRVISMHDGEEEKISRARTAPVVRNWRSQRSNDLLDEFWEGDPYLLRFPSFSIWLLHVSTAEYDPLKAG
ncbi:hypothetical protein SADUNF_Sadunf02G0042300 [Salix dunnii]|uniref:Uncharacterized protein n=1 Tax=Salix dunnii TaxID=1413687 RepID=A0A835TG66_9ROSI|nr:hypothetical protein SADUNF_Sadunf02G0042300 [Salix dunnii]